MSRILSFGQPLGSIMQTAYVVDDLEAAAHHWTKTLGIGPWFLLEHFEADNKTYYGAPTDVDLSVALAYSGSMCYELVFVHNDVPNVYADVVREKGYGCFHHWALSTESFDEDVERLKKQGHEMAFYGEVRPVGGKRFAYLDTRKTNGGMIELIELSADVEGLFAMVKDMSVNWDGKNIIRRPE